MNTSDMEDNMDMKWNEFTAWADGYSEGFAKALALLKDMAVTRPASSAAFQSPYCKSGAEEQIDRLAEYIMSLHDAEDLPRGIVEGGAGDTAIKIIKHYRAKFSVFPALGGLLGSGLSGCIRHPKGDGDWVISNVVLHGSSATPEWRDKMAELIGTNWSNGAVLLLPENCRVFIKRGGVEKEIISL